MQYITSADPVPIHPLFLAELPLATNRIFDVLDSHLGTPMERLKWWILTFVTCASGWSRRECQYFPANAGSSPNTIVKILRVAKHGILAIDAIVRRGTRRRVQSVIT